MSGGFHPFHPGHLALYNSAKQSFSGADVVVGATNVQKERPFNFKDKATLATIAGVDKGHFVEVNRQFSVKGEPNIENRIQNPDDTILIFVRSVKDANDPVLQPWKLNPDGSVPMTKGSKNHPPRPTSNYLLSYKGNEKQLQPMTKHAYIAFLPVQEFGPTDMTSATQIRNAWPTLNDKRKQTFAMSLYPATQQNSKLLSTVVSILNRNIGVVSEPASNPLETPAKGAINKLKANKLKEQIQRMRPLIKEASIEQKYKMLKLIKEATQLDELNLFGKKPNTPAPKKSVNYDEIRRMAAKPGGTQQKVYYSPEEFRKEQEKKLKLADEGVAEGIGDKVSDPASSKEFVSNRYVVKFTPTEVLFYRGGELVYRKLGDYSNPTRAAASAAKRITADLWEKDRQGIVPNLEFVEIEKKLADMLRELNLLERAAKYGTYEKRKYAKKYNEVAAKLKELRSTQSQWKKKSEGVAEGRFQDDYPEYGGKDKNKAITYDRNVGMGYEGEPWSDATLNWSGDKPTYADSTYEPDTVTLRGSDGKEKEFSPDSPEVKTTYDRIYGITPKLNQITKAFTQAEKNNPNAQYQPSTTIPPKSNQFKFDVKSGNPITNTSNNSNIQTQLPAQNPPNQPVAAKPKPGSWQELARINKITDPTKLQAGSRINTPDGGSIHVNKGDTLSGIAQKIRNNTKVNEDYLPEK
jgi:LysM repeat protein